MCAMTVAEGDSENKFKTDVSVVINNGKNYVLRTSLESYEKWIVKYGVLIVYDISLAKKFNKKGQAKLIDQEVWVFGVDATDSDDIIAAVNIAIAYYSQGGYKLIPKDILGDVFIKNLNAEGEEGMNKLGLIRANKDLYKNLCVALKKSGEHFKLPDLKVMIFSLDKNPKISRADLHASLAFGGVSSVVVDEKMYRVVSGSNDGMREFPHKTNLHIATISI